MELIERERRHAQEGRPARIIAKMNALVDPRASQRCTRRAEAGVQDRSDRAGDCCLRPGVAGVSENIRVISIVDKFLEHSRIIYFENDGDPEVFLASADWMPRNFHRRVELMFPVRRSDASKAASIDGILGVMLADNVKSRVLQPDGTYERVQRQAERAPDTLAGRIPEYGSRALRLGTTHAVPAFGRLSAAAAAGNVMMTDRQGFS